MNTNKLLKVIHALYLPDLTLTQYLVLFTIAQHPNQTITQLVRSGKLLPCGTAADLCATVRRLSIGRCDREGLGLVRRTPSPIDKRRRLLSLTEKGNKLVASIYKRIKSYGYKDTYRNTYHEKCKR